MNKLIGMLLIMGFCSGCSRAYWSPNWDKAETERSQLAQQELQTKALEKIANSLEKLLTPPISIVELPFSTNSYYYHFKDTGTVVISFTR